MIIIRYNKPSTIHITTDSWGTFIGLTRIFNIKPVLYKCAYFMHFRWFWFILHTYPRGVVEQWHGRKFVE